MKIFALAAALAVAFPAFAQDATSAAVHAGADQIAAPATPFNAEETPGGYMPANSPYSSPPSVGEKVVFSAEPLTPSEAYPAPAPRSHYPQCSSKRTDGCLQTRN
jgi:hypothetical protein